MRIDGGNLALGAIIGIGLTLITVVIADLFTVYDSAFCEDRETALSCVRNWSETIAIIAAAATSPFGAEWQSMGIYWRAVHSEDTKYILAASLL